MTICEIYSLLKSGKYIGGGAPIRFERYSFPLWCNDFLCQISFGITGLYSDIFCAKKQLLMQSEDLSKKTMEVVATAKLLKQHGKTHKQKYTTLHRNHLINSTRKYDDLGDWLYFKLMFKSGGALIKAAFGDTAEYDKLLDELFYEYNDEH